MAPLIPLAMQLAQFAPAVIKWLTNSDKAAEASQTVVDIATRVTGASDPVEALAKITASTQAQLDFQRAVMDSEATLDVAFLSDRKDARDRDVKLAQAGVVRRRPDVLVALAFTGVFLVIAVLLAAKVDGASAVGGFLIAVGTMFIQKLATAYDFEFGSSRSSQDKDMTISTLTKQR